MVHNLTGSAQTSNGFGPYVTPLRPSNDIVEESDGFLKEYRYTRCVRNIKISILASRSPKHTLRPDIERKHKQMDTWFMVVEKSNQTCHHGHAHSA